MTLDPDFSKFFNVSRRQFFTKSIVKSEWSGRLKPRNILKIIEHGSYSIIYCKISLHVYSGSSSLSNVGPILDSPGINLSENEGLLFLLIIFRLTNENRL